jgi:hypothetical protein
MNNSQNNHILLKDTFTKNNYNISDQGKIK